MSRILVAYFSASGVTAKVAKRLAQVTGAAIYEIEPAVPYTSADLDWRNQNSRSTIEVRDKSSRPELKDHNAPVAESDTIFLGFPIWWYTAPPIIRTFLESYDFAGKKIVLFATSGSSGIGQTAADLSEYCPGADVENGRVLKASIPDAELKEWADSML